MSDSRKVTEDKRHPSALTAAVLDHVESTARFVGDPPGVAESWDTTPTRNTAVMAIVSDEPDLIPTDPDTGIVDKPITDETTRPTSTGELVEAVDAGRISPTAALHHMAHRGRRKK